MKNYSFFHCMSDRPYDAGCDAAILISNESNDTLQCEPVNQGRGAYDTTGTPKPPPLTPK